MKRATSKKIKSLFAKSKCLDEIKNAVECVQDYSHPLYKIGDQCIYFESYPITEHTKLLFSTIKIAKFNRDKNKWYYAMRESNVINYCLIPEDMLIKIHE